jgi:hypothetical protein
MAPPFSRVEGASTVVAAFGSAAGSEVEEAPEGAAFATVETVDRTRDVSRSERGFCVVFELSIEVV